MLEQDFYEQLNVSEFGKQYLQLVRECRYRVLVPEKGYEIHHIQPTALGGLNTSENKVKLTVFEHCKAHALLAQAIPCYKTLQPLTRMTLGQVTKLCDLEKMQLESLYHWSDLRYRALHHPKSPELIEKNRKGHLGKKFSKEHIEKRTARRRGTISITDGIVSKFIQPVELAEFERLGWKRGIGSIRRERLRTSHTGKVSSIRGYRCIHRGSAELKVSVGSLSEYLKKGWQLGRSEAFKKKRTLSVASGATNLGKVRIRRGNEGKVVPKNEVENYLKQGWEMGRKQRNIKYSE